MPFLTQKTDLSQRREIKLLRDSGRMKNPVWPRVHHDNHAKTKEANFRTIWG